MGAAVSKLALDRVGLYPQIVGQAERSATPWFLTVYTIAKLAEGLELDFCTLCALALSGCPKEQRVRIKKGKLSGLHAIR